MVLKKDIYYLPLQQKQTQKSEERKDPKAKYSFKVIILISYNSKERVKNVPLFYKFIFLFNRPKIQTHQMKYRMIMNQLQDVINHRKVEFKPKR